MRRLLGVGVVLLLALAAPIDSAEAQGPPRDRGRLGQNYPNPFNPETRIPFELIAADFQGGRPARVTITIYNSLAQVVGHPRALNGSGEVVNNLEFQAPGNYDTFWDGKDLNGNEVASGVYLALLQVNGQRVGIIRMLVNK